MIAAGLEAGEPVIAHGSSPTDPADPDGARRPATDPAKRTNPSRTNTLGPTLVAIAALVLYAATRFLTGIHDPLGVGLAAVPLFFAAAFLPRRRAMLIGLGTVLVTVIPAGFDHGDWSVIDAGIVAELAILALASLALRSSMSRAAAAAANEAAQEAVLTDRLQAVLGIAERLTTTLDRDEIFRTIVTEVNRALETDGTTIRILDGDRASVVASAGIPDDVVARLPILRSDEAWFGELVRDRKPVADDGSGKAPEDRAIYAGILDIQSSLVVPLLLDDRVIGALAAFSHAPRTWSTADVEFAVAVATHAAMAIHNADLFARTEGWAAQLAVLQAASARMSRARTRSRPWVGRSSKRSARSSTTTTARVYVLEEPDEVVPIAFEGRVGTYEDVDMSLLRTKLGEGFTGWVAANGEPLLIDDANADPRGATIPGTDDVDESMLCVPMRYDERIIGVITLSKLGLRQFDADDLRLLLDPRRPGRDRGRIGPPAEPERAAGERAPTAARHERRARPEPRPAGGRRSSSPGTWSTPWAWTSARSAGGIGRANGSRPWATGRRSPRPSSRRSSCWPATRRRSGSSSARCRRSSGSPTRPPTRPRSPTCGPRTRRRRRCSRSSRRVGRSGSSSS